MSETVLRKLTRRETELLKPWLDRVRTTSAAATAAERELVRVLVLMEPRFETPGVSFDQPTLTFRETVDEPPAT